MYLPRKTRQKYTTAVNITDFIDVVVSGIGGILGGIGARLVSNEDLVGAAQIQFNVFG